MDKCEKNKNRVCSVNGTCRETKERETNEEPLVLKNKTKNVVSLERSSGLESECNGEL